MYNPGCVACPLHLRACTVCVPGEGPEQADLMIVGMNPGAQEDLRGRPFVGEAGKVLDDCLAGAGITRSQVFVTNAVKCYSGKAKPTRTELSICSDLYLKQEIARVRPRVIVALGDLALLALTAKGGVNANRGQTFPLRPGLWSLSWGNIPHVVVTYHPAAYLHAGRDLRIKQAIQADLEVARQRLMGSSSNLLEVREGEITEEVLGFDIETTKDGRFIVGTATQGDGAFRARYRGGDQGPRGGDQGPRGELARARGLVAWNAKFDLKVLQAEGVETSGLVVHDPMLILHLLDSSRKGRYGLEPAVIDEFGAADPDWLEAKRIVHSQGAEALPLDRLTRYCAQDSLYGLRLFNRFYPRLQANPQLLMIYEHIVLPAMHLLTRVEQQPVPLDVGYIRDLDADLKAHIGVLAAEMRELAGLRELPNFRSNRVLAEVLFKKLGLPVVRLTDTGAPSTAKPVLMSLRHLSPFVELLLRYRRLEKLRKAYTQRWLRLTQ